MFVVILLNFFVGNRSENFVRNVGADDFQRDLRRLGETRRRGGGVRRYVAVLFVKFLQFLFRRIRDFADVILGVERDDARLHRTVRRFERARQVDGNAERTRINVTSDGAFVSDLLLQEVEQQTVVQSAGGVTVLPILRRERTADQRLQILRRGFVVRGQPFIFSKLNNQPTVDHLLRILQRDFQLRRERVEPLRLRGFVRVFFRQRTHIKLREVVFRNVLRHLSGLRPRFGVQRIERRSRETRQTRRRVAHFLERNIVERSVFARFRDFAHLRAVPLPAGSDALHHRP